MIVEPSGAESIAQHAAEVQAYQRAMLEICQTQAKQLWGEDELEPMEYEALIPDLRTKFEPSRWDRLLGKKIEELVIVGKGVKKGDSIGQSLHITKLKESTDETRRYRLEYFDGRRRRVLVVYDGVDVGVWAAVTPREKEIIMQTLQAVNTQYQTEWAQTEQTDVQNAVLRTELESPGRKLRTGDKNDRFAIAALLVDGRVLPAEQVNQLKRQPSIAVSVPKTITNPTA